MRSFTVFAVPSIVALVLAAAGPAEGATIVIDDFEDGTTMNWSTGQVVLFTPKNALGGPAGLDDNFLLLQSVGGNDPGSRLSVLNDAQWAGDYLAAGITSLSMDVNNFGTTDILLRLAFYDLSGAVEIAHSTDPIIIKAGSGWIPIEFLLSAASLTVTGAGAFEDVLSSTTLLRIYHSDLSTAPTPPTVPAIVATLGIDNIGAQAAPASVPEPGLLVLMTSGVLLAIQRRRTRVGR